MSRQLFAKLAFVSFAVIGILALGFSTARASFIDLTTVGASGTANGAIFTQVSPQPTGTGVIQSFVRVQNNGIEQGYNTDHRPVQFDEKTDATFTHSILLSDIPITQIGGVNYRVFLLDINQIKNDPDNLLSLDIMQVFQTNNPSITGYNTVTGNFGASAVKVYDLNNYTGDPWIKLNYALNPGSGAGDMTAAVPDSVFSNAYSNVVLRHTCNFG